MELFKTKTLHKISWSYTVRTAVTITDGLLRQVDTTISTVNTSHGSSTSTMTARMKKPLVIEHLERALQANANELEPVWDRCRDAQLALATHKTQRPAADAGTDKHAAWEAEYSRLNRRTEDLVTHRDNLGTQRAELLALMDRFCAEMGRLHDATEDKANESFAAALTNESSLAELTSGTHESDKATFAIGAEGVKNETSEDKISGQVYPMSPAISGVTDDHSMHSGDYGAHGTHSHQPNVRGGRGRGRGHGRGRGRKGKGKGADGMGRRGGGGGGGANSSGSGASSSFMKADGATANTHHKDNIIAPAAATSTPIGGSEIDERMEGLNIHDGSNENVSWA